MGKHIGYICFVLCIVNLLVNGCSSRIGMEPKMEEIGVEEFHRKVGERLELLYAAEIENHYESLVYHYSRSDNKEKAIHYLVKSGDRDKEAYANKQAIRYYIRALELTDEIHEIAPSTLGHIYISLADVYMVIDNNKAASDFAHRTLESSDDKGQRARSYQILGRIHGGDRSYAIEQQNLAIAELGDDAESPEMPSILIELFWPTLYIGHIEKAIEIAWRGLEMAERMQNYNAISQLYICLLWVHMQPSYGINEMDKGFGYAQKSMEAAQKSGDIYSIGHSSFWLGWAHMRRGEDNTAIKLMKEAIEVYRKTGHNFHLRQAYSWLSGIYLRKGDMRGLIDMTKQAIER